MRFPYDESYHMGFSKVLCKISCDDYAGCLGNELEQTNMSSWISDHGRCKRKINTNCEGPMTTKGLLEDCLDFLGE